MNENQEEKHEIALPCPFCFHHETENKDELCPECQGKGTITLYLTEAQMEELINILYFSDKFKVLQDLGVISSKQPSASRCPFAKGH